MARGLVAMALDPFDLGLERLDPRGEFVEGERTEVLFGQTDEGIVGFRGKEIVEVHGPQR